MRDIWLLHRAFRSRVFLKLRIYAFQNVVGFNLNLFEIRKICWFDNLKPRICFYWTLNVTFKHMTLICVLFGFSQWLRLLKFEGYWIVKRAEGILVWVDWLLLGNKLLPQFWIVFKFEIVKLQFYLIIQFLDFDKLRFERGVIYFGLHF